MKAFLIKLFSGIWLHPQSTIGGVVVGALGIAASLGWIDPGTAAQKAGVYTSILVFIVGALCKGGQT